MCLCLLNVERLITKKNNVTCPIGFVLAGEGMQIYKCNEPGGRNQTLSLTKHCAGIIFNTVTSQTTIKPKWVTITNNNQPSRTTQQLNQQFTGNVKVTFQIPPGNRGVCNDFKVKQALQKNISIGHSLARPCKSGSGHNYEAAIFALCQAPYTSQWKKDQKVKGNCHNLQLNIPVSPFINNRSYSGDGVGILTECLQSGGFKVARQSCDGNGFEEIEIQASGSSGLLTDPEAFYTIRW